METAAPRSRYMDFLSNPSPSALRFLSSLHCCSTLTRWRKMQTAAALGDSSPGCQGGKGDGTCILGGGGWTLGVWPHSQLELLLKLNCCPHFLS
uniref:Uncharacterized protein n=1 Tax=Aegilops tauschii subsp. strangulata TaxID=200361 RepID=A0A453NCR0_AEGTS